MIHVGDRGRGTPGWPRTAATMPGRPRWPGRHSPSGRRRSCRGRPASSHTLRGGRDPGVDLRRRLTVGNDRCGPPSCHAMSSGVRLSTSGRLPWASRVSRTLSLATTDRCQDLSARSVLHVGKPAAWETAARRLTLVGMPSSGAAPNARTARGTRMTVGPSRRRWMRLRT